MTYATVLKVMKKRRKLAGPERLRHRSEWDNWNYKAELYAFAKRLNEELSEETLRTVFAHKSYILHEENRRKQLGLPAEDIEVKLDDNSALALQGTDIMSPFIKAFIRHSFPDLPEEGVIAVHDYLMTDDTLSHVSANIGTKDLILCAEFPVEKPTLATVFKALVGAIATDMNQKRAETFVLDFVLTQLVGKDVLDIWEIPNPLATLNTLLEKHCLAPAESRLVFESGRNTLEAIYQVAIYSDKEFLGQGPGETVAIAEEMAAFDALRLLFKLKLDNRPLPFRNKDFDFNVKSF